MKSVQEILDLALDSNLYISREEYDSLDLPVYDAHSYYMCDVLEVLQDQGIITQEELLKATGEITDYISDSENSGGVSSLEIFLKEHSLPSSHEDKIKIYKNWDMIPMVVYFQGSM